MSDTFPTTAIAINLAEPEAMRQTMMLRWRQVPHTTTKPPVLEQAWVGERGRIEWRPVPLVIGEDSANVR